MSTRHATSAPWAIIVLMAIASVLPGCGRAPEEPEPAPEPMTAITEGGPVSVGDSLELPLTNPEIGVILQSVPDGLVATYNGEQWIELTDRQRPKVRYTLVSEPKFAPGVSAPSIDEYQEIVTAYEDGRFTGSGEIDTDLGRARWVSGFYMEDGEAMNQILVSVPDPSGDGQLTVSSLAPSGATAVEQRLEVIRQLLTGVS